MTPHSAFRISLLLSFVLLLLAFSAAAQPPNRLHYQGRLTNSAGVPITTAQTVYFSLWSGGTANAAGVPGSSQTQFYREHATIQPASNGVFEHLVGSGTVDSGALTPSSFNTGNPVFLQIEVGSPAVVLLPRVQITSVGYAFYAAQAGSVSSPGGLRVTSVTDKTGGSTVIGDLLQIDGDGLSGTTVTVGGRVAPIVGARSATRITCQVPQGIPMGPNPVAVIDQANSLNSLTVAHVNVHRLIVWVTLGANPQIVIVDALTGAKLAELNPPSTLGRDLDSFEHLQMAFANNGSLAIIPSNNNGGMIYSIDLTANPPALVGNGFSSGAGRAVAVSVSPDDKLMVISDFLTNGQNGLRFALINQAAPPYTGTPFSQTFPNLIDFSYATGFGYPRGSAFIGNNLLAVCSTGPTGKGLFAFRRIPGTNNFYHYRPDDLTVDIQNRIYLSDPPFAIYPTRDRTRLYVMSQTTPPSTIPRTASVSRYFTAPEGFSDIEGSPLNLDQAWGVAVSPDGDYLFAADSYATNVRSSRIKALNFATDFIRIGELEDTFLPVVNSNAFQLTALEPAEGRQLAVGTNTDRLLLFNCDGGALTIQKGVQIYFTQRDTYELQYQP